MWTEARRDFIMAVTVEGEVVTLPLGQILRVQSASTSPAISHVVMARPGRAERTLVIQEPAEGFLERCERLRAALLERDHGGINRYLAPPLVDMLL